VALDLGAETEDHAAARGSLEVPGRVGDYGGAPGKRDGDRGAEAHPPRVLRGERERQERVVPGLRRPETVDPQVLGLPGERRHLAEIVDRDRHVELHAGLR
jgi:hypothetical protein